MYVYVSVHVYICVCMYMCMCVCIHMCVCMCALGAGTLVNVYINITGVTKCAGLNTAMGIYIHKLKDHNGEISSKGENPFDYVYNNSMKKLSSIIKVYEPKVNYFDQMYSTDKTLSQLIYKNIGDNIAQWVDESISQRNTFKLFGY